MMVDGWALGGTYDALVESIPAIPLPSSNFDLVTNDSTKTFFTRSAATTAEQCAVIYSGCTRPCAPRTERRYGW